MLPSGYPRDSSTIDLATIQSITPPQLRDEVLSAIAQSIQVRLCHGQIITAAFSRHDHLDDLDVVLSVPRLGGSRKSSSYTDGVAGLSF